MSSGKQAEEREAFEAWFDGFRHGWKTERDVAHAAWQARAALSSAPAQGGEPAAWIRYEWNKSGSKSLVFEKPEVLSLAEQATGVVYEPLYAALSSAPVPQWFDEPFVAEGLQSLGLQSPTPREFGGTIARRYAARIKELEATLSSRPVQPVREPMTDAQIEALDFVGRGVISVRDMVRIVERHHGITKE